MQHLGIRPVRTKTQGSKGFISLHCFWYGINYGQGQIWLSLDNFLWLKSIFTTLFPLQLQLQ